MTISFPWDLMITLGKSVFAIYQANGAECFRVQALAIVSYPCDTATTSYAIASYIPNIDYEVIISHPYIFDLLGTIGTIWVNFGLPSSSNHLGQSGQQTRINYQRIGMYAGLRSC